MNVLILNGSPRPQGNTAKMISAFRETAEGKGHTVNVVDVCRKNIHGCLACEHCHQIEHGVCVQKDDMQEVYGFLKEAEMLILASPIYYHGISGQLKCTIDRFYAALYPKEHFNLSKIAMFLCSGDPDMYVGAEFSFKGDFLEYLGLEDKGIYTCAKEINEEVLEQVRRLAEEL
jgi:multimeric flavodoxin WrbA